MTEIKNHYGRPRGIRGSIVLGIMNKGHEPLTRWGLSFADIKKESRVIDIGCGGGNAIYIMSQQSDNVTGIDYSAAAIKKSTRKNRQAIAEGRVSLRQASVADIPFEDNSFDIATAFETIYFWPDWRQNFGEVLRVLKPGGRFFAIYEVYNDRQLIESRQKQLQMKIAPPEEAKQLFLEAGFSGVEIKELDMPKLRNICLIGQK